MNKTMNGLFFGNIEILPDGSVWDNLNFEKIGLLHDDFADLMLAMYKEKGAWFYKREQYPCNKCLYQWPITVSQDRSSKHCILFRLIYFNGSRIRFVGRCLREARSVHGTHSSHCIAVRYPNSTLESVLSVSGFECSFMWFVLCL